MKKILIAGAFILMVSSSSTAVTFKTPDAEFIKQAETIGMTGKTWETPNYIASAMPHVYKFTHSFTLHKGEYVSKLERANKQLNLDSIMINDFDGNISVKDFLLNRMQNHNTVIVKDGKIAHEHYGNGMDEFSPHLDMSVSKSFTAMAGDCSGTRGT